MTAPPYPQNPPLPPRLGPRLGPRPLSLHLAAAQATWRRSVLAWQSWSASSPPWKIPPTAVLALADDLAGVATEPFTAALEQEIAARSSAFLTAIAAYRRHPYERSLTDPPALWQEGATRLLDFGDPKDSRPPVLLVPSLVNRAYILDLMEERSFARWLATEEAAGGFRPLLLDWGDPGGAESGFCLTDYIVGRLEKALDRVLTETGRPPLVLGYCMGGLLALALAQRRGRDVSGLALLATPWDFHAVPGQAAVARSALLSWSPVMELLDQLPVDAVQALFATLDPLTAVHKFRRFARLDPQSAEAQAFVALEDWLNDGVALTAPVARECLGGWYARNEPVKGRWRVAGQPVEPAAVEVPALCVIPKSDRIVPPASARALAAALPHASLQQPAAGHIGMIASARARKTLWPELANWLAQKGRTGTLRGRGQRSKVQHNAALRREGPARGARLQDAAAKGRKRKRSDPA